VVQAGGERHRQELVVIVDLGEERRLDQIATQAQRGRIAAFFGVDQANVQSLGQGIQDVRVAPRAVGDDDQIDRHVLLRQHALDRAVQGPQARGGGGGRQDHRDRAHEASGLIRFPVIARQQVGRVYSKPTC
jgi:hypothetical protein